MFGETDRNAWTSKTIFYSASSSLREGPYSRSHYQCRVIPGAEYSTQKMTLRCTTLLTDATNKTLQTVFKSSYSSPGMAYGASLEHPLATSNRRLIPSGGALGFAEELILFPNRQIMKV